MVAAFLSDGSGATTVPSTSAPVSLSSLMVFPLIVLSSIFSLNTILIGALISILGASLSGTLEAILGGVVSVVIVVALVLNDHFSSDAMAFPAESFTPVVTLTVYFFPFSRGL